MDRFRRWIIVAVLAGSAAGLLLFVVQHLTVVPLIAAAETHEAATHASMPGMVHEDEGWQPAAGLERIALTALNTMLSGIGFAAVLLAAMVVSGGRINAGRGVLWGLAGFACFTLAPALGMPPMPPGAAVPELAARQFWWLGTVTATALGIWLLVARIRPWPARLAGLACLALPHAIGAPAAGGVTLVPAELMQNFAIVSVATTGLFWIVAGILCGLLLSRQEAPAAPPGIGISA